MGQLQHHTPARACSVTSPPASRSSAHPPAIAGDLGCATSQMFGALECEPFWIATSASACFLGVALAVEVFAAHGMSSQDASNGRRLCEPLAVASPAERSWSRCHGLRRSEHQCGNAGPGLPVRPLKQRAWSSPDPGAELRRPERAARPGKAGRATRGGCTDQDGNGPNSAAPRRGGRAGVEAPQQPRPKNARGASKAETGDMRARRHRDQARVDASRGKEKEPVENKGQPNKQGPKAKWRKRTNQSMQRPRAPRRGVISNPGEAATPRREQAPGTGRGPPVRARRDGGPDSYHEV